MNIELEPMVVWAARDAVLAQLKRARELAKCDARYRITVARQEAVLRALDAALELEPTP